MNNKSKIPSIEQLEQKFLSVASESGFRVMRNADTSIDLDKTISRDVARADVAMFARLLIQAYGGWPFYPQILRRRILTALSRIYNSISKPIKIRDLYEQLKSIIKMMPDKHIMVAGDKSPAVNMSTAIDVGDNLVKTRNINKPYLIEKQGRVGIIAISRFFEPDDKAHLERIKKQVLAVMSGTDAIIIDLRNNGGGAPQIASMLGETLSGYDALPNSRRMFARNTPIARNLQQYIDMPALKNVSVKDKNDPVMIVDNSKFKMPKNYKWAYNGDIYVLANNRSASSSERVMTFMKYNPRTKIIGTHSSGCLQYINYRFVVLSGSGISVRLPLVYKEVPHAKPRGFETHGFEPDIVCEPGTDAFKVAIDMINAKPNILYHGSGAKIKGFIRVKPAYLTKNNQPITAVFALSDFVHAKLYAIMRLVAGEGKMAPCERDAVYIQRINKNIPKKAYVYELDSDGFQQDKGGSYYCLTDKKIKNIIEIDVIQEIKNGDLKVYILKDEFNIKNMSRDAWKEILKDKSKFELYKPNTTNVNVSMLAQTVKSSSLNK